MYHADFIARVTEIQSGRLTNLVEYELQHLPGENVMMIIQLTSRDLFLFSETVNIDLEEDFSVSVNKQVVAGTFKLKFLPGLSELSSCFKNNALTDLPYLF
jgi:hypothetical protein